MGKIKTTKPFKMKIWLTALQTILDTRKIIFLSDDDLVMLVNREIKKNGDPRCTIDPRTFRNWKAGKFAPNDEIGREFMETLALAYVDQKELVGQQMFECESKDKGDWRRFSFVLERRFREEFGQNNTLELTNKKETNIQIVASDNDQKTLLESLLSGDVKDIHYQEVQPLKIDSSTDNKQEEEYEF